MTVQHKKQPPFRMFISNFCSIKAHIVCSFLVSSRQKKGKERENIATQHEIYSVEKIDAQQEDVSIQLMIVQSYGSLHAK